MSLDRIVEIIFGSPKVQMIWVYAKAFIALMKHPHGFRDFAKVDYPRLPMSAHLSPGWTCRDNKSPIIFIISGTNPKPTGLGFLNELPKSVQKWFGFSSNFHDNDHIKVGAI